MSCGAERVGRETNGRPRLLILTFENVRHTEEILMNKIKLSWTNNDSIFGNFNDVYVDPDISREERQRMYTEIRGRNVYRGTSERGRGLYKWE